MVDDRKIVLLTTIVSRDSRWELRKTGEASRHERRKMRGNNMMAKRVLIYSEIDLFTY